MPKKKKAFVLDTNVILHDSSCIHHFQENDIIVPITVLEELDHFKKGNESINYHAREFIRSLDALAGDSLFNGGIKIGPNLGKLSIKLEQEYHSDHFMVSARSGNNYLLFLRRSFSIGTTHGNRFQSVRVGGISSYFL